MFWGWVGGRDCCQGQKRTVWTMTCKVNSRSSFREIITIMTWVLRQGNVTLLLRLTFFVCMCESNPALQRAVPPASPPATSQVRVPAAMPTATLGEITLGNQSRPVPGLTKPTYYPLLFSVRVCGLLCNRVVSLYAWASAPGCGCQLFMRLFPRET